MWQRIQTLYLLLAAATITLLLFLPMAHIIVPNAPHPYWVNATGISNGATMWNINFISFVLALLAALIPLVTIFLFKKRILQIRFSVFAILMVIAFIGSVSFDSYRFASANAGSFEIKPALFLPLLTLLFLYLSIRRIAFDEALVRASNRLR